MAYTFGNKCAKNLCKRIVLLQLIIENVVTCFFGTQCIFRRLDRIPTCDGQTDGQTFCDGIVRAMHNIAR